MSRHRVGLLIGSKGLLAWHEQIITTLTDHAGIEFVGFSRLPDEADGHASSRHWLDRLETLFSHRLFKTKRADAPLVTKQLDSAPAVVVIDDLDADLVVSLDGDAHTRLPTNAGAREIWHLTFDGIDRSDGRVAAGPGEAFSIELADAREIERLPLSSGVRKS